MIITNVCLLLEALSIVICLHHLYGEKFRLDIATVSFLSIDMIIMTAINYFGLPKMYLVTMVVYPIIALYCGIRFGFKLKLIVSNVVLCVILVGGIQMLGMLSVYYFGRVQNFSDINLLLVNCMTFFIAVIILPIIKVKRLSKFSQDNGKIVIAVLGVCLAWVLFLVISYKNLEALELRQAIMLFVSIILVFVLAGQLNKYKIRAKEIETELKMHELYSESFKRLIENIQLKQHEFDNHINAIYSLHYSCQTLEELVELQKSYCRNITEENRFSKLLTSDNAVVSGFLYSKFEEIDRMGIKIDYRLILKGKNTGVPVYKTVEILGNLINNAVEELKGDNEKKKLYVEVVETDKLIIEVRNESPYISYDTLESFFSKGYSKKGESRGLGLYNIKQICEEYDLNIAPKWMEIEGSGWLSFKIWKEVV